MTCHYEPRNISVVMGEFPDDFLETIFNFTEPQVCSSEQMHADLKEIALSFARYVHDEGISRVAFMDRSARPAHAVLRAGYKHLFPKSTLPERYFLNPDGFQERTQEEIHQDMESSFPKLCAQKDAPLLLYDTCSHSGMTLLSTYTALDAIGFTDIRVGLAQPEQPCYCPLMEPEHVSIPRKAEIGCTPFFSGMYVAKGKNVLSKRNDDVHETIEGLVQREKLSTMLKNAF